MTTIMKAPQTRAGSCNVPQGRRGGSRNARTSLLTIRGRGVRAWFSERKGQLGRPNNIWTQPETPGVSLFISLPSFTSPINDN